MSPLTSSGFTSGNVIEPRVFGQSLDLNPVVVVLGERLAGKSRLERQRMVYAILADELKERVHALELKLKAPGET